MMICSDEYCINLISSYQSFYTKKTDCQIMFHYSRVRMWLVGAMMMLLIKGAIAQAPTIIDAAHYSNVFGETRNYRVFLPPGYANNPEKRYPVIYFLHGWSQRYFGDGGEEYAGFDKGEQNKGDNIAAFVAKNEVIVVKWDGYNRSINEEYYKRPYNVSAVETFRQFPIYFPELMQHIDVKFRTIADREHRALTGLSMGGYMTYWIAAKYPHLFSAAGSFCGSPEFIVGPRDFPAEYRHIDMYKNFAGMNVRLHYGDKDFIRPYHEDMNRIWPQVMNNYEWKIYDAEHSTCGLGEMFSHFMKTFSAAPEKPATWHHIDVYPEFSVWNYEVSTDRNVPGFTILEQVNARGFRCAVRERVPDGQLLQQVNVMVTTAPLYEKNQVYTIHDLQPGIAPNITTVKSDHEGKLHLRLNGNVHEIGINKKNDKANITVASTQITNMPWAVPGAEIQLDIQLLNKGAGVARNVTATISATRKNVVFKKNQLNFGDINVNDSSKSKDQLTFTIVDTVEIVQLRADIRDGNRNEWSQLFEIPVKKKVQDFQNIVIADGKVFTVANEGTGIASAMLGSGNGDGIANPGESIVLLVKDQDKLWRTDISHGDKNINPFGVNERISDNWTNFDHTGASAKYSVLLISGDCPQNHKAEVFASYWTPQYPYHIVKEGKIHVTVQGRDITAPLIDDMQVQGDNRVEVKIMDGSPVREAGVILTAKYEPTKQLKFVLNDGGQDGDRVKGDNIFSAKVPEQKFGLYRLLVEAADAHGNKSSKESTTDFVIH